MVINTRHGRETMTSTKSFPEQDVPASGTPLDAGQLAAIVERIAAADPAARISQGTMRRWTLAEETATYQAWIIAWPAGAGLGLHDHSGSAAAIHVADGQLRERYTTDSGLTVRWIDNGSTVQLPHDHIHEVVNVGSLEAISVHAYSPPILDMSFRTDPSIDLGTTDIA